MKHTYRNIDIPLYRGFGEFGEFSIIVSGDGMNETILAFHDLFNRFQVDVVKDIFVDRSQEIHRLAYCSDWMNATALRAFVDLAIEKNMLSGIRYSDAGIIGPQNNYALDAVMYAMTEDADILTNLNGELAVVQLPARSIIDDFSGGEVIRYHGHNDQHYLLIAMEESVTPELETHWMLTHGATCKRIFPKAETPDLSTILP